MPSVGVVYTPKDKVDAVASEARFGFCSLFIYVFFKFFYVICATAAAFQHQHVAFLLWPWQQMRFSTACGTSYLFLPVSIVRLHLLSEQKPVKEQLNNSSGDINYIIEHILAPAQQCSKAARGDQQPRIDLFQTSSPGRCHRRYDDPIHHTSCEHILSAFLIPPAH